jgi:hypothetical protein
MLTLNERIEYWRGRARLAKRFSLSAEEVACSKIAATLKGAARVQAQADKAVDRIVDSMPNELYDQEAN